MNIETFNIPVYVCGCGYKTIDKGNSANKEMISNVSMAREVFYEFIEMTR
jgi:hypothetical protein